MCCCIFIARGRVCAVYSVLGRKEPGEICTWVPPEATCAFFPYDPIVYPYYIIVINTSHEYNYMLSPVGPSSEHPNTVLGTPDTCSFGILALLYHYVTAFYRDIINLCCRPCIPSHESLKDRNMPYMYFHLVQLIAQNTQEKPKKYLLRQ